MDWEINFLKYIIDNIHNDKMTAIMSVITTLGNCGFIWIFIALILIIINRTRKTGFTMAVSLVSVFITVNLIIKPLIDRERPFEKSIDILNSLLIALPSDSSFPSGHTSAAFAGAVAVLCCNRKLGIPLIIFAVLMGISRIYFAVHFPTDVIGGFLIGSIIGIISYRLVKKIINKRKKS